MLALVILQKYVERYVDQQNICSKCSANHIPDILEMYIFHKKIFFIHLKLELLTQFLHKTKKYILWKVY